MHFGDARHCRANGAGDVDASALGRRSGLPHASPESDGFDEFLSEKLNLFSEFLCSTDIVDPSCFLNSSPRVKCAMASWLALRRIAVVPAFPRY
jgi:hypothetical protein